MKYRKKPVVIEARQITVTNIDEIAAWCGGRVHDPNGIDYHSTLCIYIPTLEGQMMAMPGWWVIEGVEGEFYPCRADIFEQTYEAVT